MTTWDALLPPTRTTGGAGEPAVDVNKLTGAIVELRDEHENLELLTTAATNAATNATAATAGAVAAAQDAAETAAEVAATVDGLTADVSAAAAAAAATSATITADQVARDAASEIVNGKADDEHTHDIGDVTGLQGQLDALATNVSQADLEEGLATRALVTHVHTIAQVTGLTEELEGLLADGDYTTAQELADAIATRAAAAHTHTTAQVTNLDTSLAGKAPTVHTHSSGQITDFHTGARELHIEWNGTVWQFWNGTQWTATLPTPQAWQWVIYHSELYDSPTPPTPFAGHTRAKWWKKKVAP